MMTPSEKGDNPVAFVGSDLTLGGFTWPGNTEKLLKGSVWVAVENAGRGRVVLFADDPLFSRLLARHGQAGDQRNAVRNREMTMMNLRALACLTGLALNSCGSKPAPESDASTGTAASTASNGTPESAARVFAEALRSGDFAAAARAMHPSALHQFRTLFPADALGAEDARGGKPDVRHDPGAVGPSLRTRCSLRHS
jgi:hypothetical protein